MHDEDIRRRSLAPAHEDEIMERSVLTQVLVLHPAQLTILELALRVEADRQEAGQDAVERAVRELSRDGLLSCDCRRIAASRAAIRFEQLIGGCLMSGNVISTELKRQLGRTLRRHRNRVGLSQEDLSFRAGLHRTAVGQIERGERIARVDTLIKLATGLGVSVAALVEGVTWEPSSFRPGGFAVGGGGRGNAED